MSRGGEREEFAAPPTDRVNSAPAILRGLSATETMLALAVFFVMWLAVSIVLYVITRSWMVIPLLSAIGPLVTVWMAGGQLAKLKRNRPDYYYMHATGWWLERIGLIRTRFITVDGAWSIGRTMPQVRPPKTRLIDQLRIALGWM